LSVMWLNIFACFFGMMILM